MLTKVSYCSSTEKVTINSPETAPLTEAGVTNNSTLRHYNHYPCRFREALYWVEDTHIATLDIRIEFINRLVTTLERKIIQRDSAITLISLGSGGLLTEYFIHQQLTRSGYHNLTWRIIDTNYSRPCFKPCLDTFIALTNSRTKAFITEQAYFNTLSDHSLLAEEDCNNRAAIILAVVPPVLENSNMLISEHTRLRGVPVTNFSEANSLYLVLNFSEKKEQVDEVIRLLYQSNIVVSYKNVVKFHFGDLRGQSASVIIPEGTLVSDKVSPLSLQMISDEIGTLRRNPDMDTETSLSQLEKVIKKLNSDNIYVEKIYISEYHVSLKAIEKFFLVNANTIIKAYLKDNLITIR